MNKKIDFIGRLPGLTLLVTGFSDKLPVLLEAGNYGEGQMFYY